jgi:hypothetical protein
LPTHCSRAWAGGVGGLPGAPAGGGGGGAVPNICRVPQNQRPRHPGPRRPAEAARALVMFLSPSKTGQPTRAPSTAPSQPPTSSSLPPTATHGERDGGGCVGGRQPYRERLVCELDDGYVDLDREGGARRQLLAGGVGEACAARRRACARGQARSGGYGAALLGDSLAENARSGLGRGPRARAQLPRRTRGPARSAARLVRPHLRRARTEAPAQTWTAWRRHRRESFGQSWRAGRRRCSCPSGRRRSSAARCCRCPPRS